jgi:hypothetical protein
VQQEAGEPDLGRDHGVHIAQFVGAGVLQAQRLVQCTLQRR